jgi:DNA polymerase I-like protein with 3'-5' exonuclease and polymerase domains
VVPHQITLDDLRHALRPLWLRSDLTAVFHNAPFDLVKLRQDGIEIRCRVVDTFKMLKLTDPDRGWEPDDEDETGRSVGTVCRWDRRFQEQLDYRLKNVVRHLLGLEAPSFPGPAASLDYDRHVDYLTSDLLITRELHLHLQSQMGDREDRYYTELVAPITSIVAEMTFTGVRADNQFITEECGRLERLMDDISAAHQRRFGVRLDVSDHTIRQWLFGTLRCKPRWDHKRVKLASGTFAWSLERDELENLLMDATTPAVRESIRLLLDHRLVGSLHSRLGRLSEHIQSDGRIHSRFDDRQASGRVTSKTPNLQQIASLVTDGQQKQLRSDEFRGVTIRSRNALVANPGYRLVAFDIAQADVRCLAHIVDSFRQTGDEYVAELRDRFESPLAPPYRQAMWDHFQPRNRKGGRTEPSFDPQLPCQLATDFRAAKADFYTVAATRMLGRKPKDKTERDRMKRTILGIVNGMSAGTLAERLGVDAATAEGYLKRFDAAYPQVVAFTDLMHQGFAITGTAYTFEGRPRRITAHWWMVTQPSVDLFLSYHGADKLWVRVVPLRANRHTLTCHVLRVVDVKRGSPREGREIYNDRQGRVSTAYYRFFDDDDLVFRLPIRNVAWRIIRRVRTTTEEAEYEGFDRVRRQLFNHLCQGATADVVKRMMIRSLPVCRAFGARLLLQIHDELVFEVPIRNTGWFVRRMRQVLETPPTPDFRVPIVVEPKVGVRFGELRGVPDRETRMPPRDLAVIVRRCLARGQYRRLQRLIAERLAGCQLNPRRPLLRVSKGTQARKLIRQILSTYQ